MCMVAKSVLLSSAAYASDMVCIAGFVCVLCALLCTCEIDAAGHMC